MPRTAAEIEAEMSKLTEGGAHHASKPMVALRNELKALDQPPDVKWVGGPSPLPASDDVAFVNEALAQLLLKGGGAKPEKAYSDIRSLLNVKHLIEDTVGLVASGRIALPPWDTLGRDRDTGAPFKPGENQAVVDGLQQRAVPPPKSSRPVVTAQDGTPLRFPKSRALDEPDGDAVFVGQGAGEAE
jgi:hypothetical protein